MEYTPRYPQPFTIPQAVGLDVGMVTEEIARLQNSLAHLRNTQEQLQEANEESPDPEFVKAIEENDGVIGSQEERISMLKMALAQKGIPMDGHYAIDFDRHLQHPIAPPLSNATSTPVPPLRPNGNSHVAAQRQPVTLPPPPAPPSGSEDFEIREDASGGIDL